MGKNKSNGNVKVGWLLASAMTGYPFLAATLLNASALDISSAIAWKNYKLGADASTSIEDRALTDLGNATTRGPAKYGATLSFYRDQNNTDTTSPYQQAFQAFRTEWVLGYLIVRVNAPATNAWAAGDTISIYKVLTDAPSDSDDGTDPGKFTLTFLAQGQLAVHTMVGAAGVITGVPTTLAKTVAGGPFQLAPIVAGQSIVSRATYSSSDLTKATVSTGGTVTPIASGSVSITTTYLAATAPIVTVVTLT